MPKYDAFISYRHTEPDKSIAEKLHKMLETYRASKIAKKIGKKKLIVFLETERNSQLPVI